MASSEPSSVLALLNPWRIFRGVWRHRELAWQFAIREIELRHRGSRLGAVWALVNPLSMLVPGAFRELFEFRAKDQPPAAPAQ